MTTETSLDTASWRDVVGTEIAKEADEWQGRINAAFHHSVSTAGTALRTMKDKMPHGSFEQWWRDELGFKDSKQVSDLMAASVALDDVPADHPLGQSSLRALAIIGRADRPAIRKAASHVEGGKRLTQAIAKRLVNPAASANPVDTDNTKSDSSELEQLRAENAELKRQLAERTEERDEAVKELWELEDALGMVDDDDDYEDPNILLRARRTVVFNEDILDRVKGWVEKDPEAKLQGVYVFGEVNGETSFTGITYGTDAPELHELVRRSGTEFVDPKDILGQARNNFNCSPVIADDLAKARQNIPDAELLAVKLYYGFKGKVSATTYKWTISDGSSFNPDLRRWIPPANDNDDPASDAVVDVNPAA